MSGEAEWPEIPAARLDSGLAIWREPHRWRVGEADARAALCAAAERLGSREAAAARRLLFEHNVAAGRLLARQLDAAHPGGDHAPCCLWLTWRASRATGRTAGTALDAAAASASVATALELAAVAAERETRTRTRPPHQVTLRERQNAYRGLRAAVWALATTLRSTAQIAMLNPFDVLACFPGEPAGSRETWAADAGGAGHEGLHDEAAVQRVQASFPAQQSPPCLRDEDVFADLGFMGSPEKLVAPRSRDAIARLERQDRARLGYLEVLANPLPLTPVPADLEARFDGLRAEFPNMSAAIDRLRDEVRLRAATGTPALSLRPLLLVGAPGVGKTRFARRLAAVLDLCFAGTSLAGVSDSRALEGTAKGWGSAHPCWPLDEVATLGVANPLLCVDEVDKCVREGRNGDPLAALLGFLEPGSAATHRDPVLGAPCDLSAVSWILTANDGSRLPGALLSRLRVVEVGPPPMQAFGAILAAIRSDLAAELGCPPEILPVLEDADLDWLEGRWRASQSPRILRKLVERLLGAAAARRPPQLN
jgi:ATPase family associated with various cellular activities (AAA)